MRASVIISSINRKSTLSRLFFDLARQTVMPDEVILIEAGDISWNIEEIPTALQDRFSVFYELSASLSFSRERGRKVATGDVIIFFDDDIIIPETYIEIALRYLNDHSEVMAVGGTYSDNAICCSKNWSMVVGRLLGIFSDGKKNRILPSGWADYVRGKYTEVITVAEWLHGCNMVVRTKVFEHPGVKIETQLVSWSFLEDVILGFRITRYWGNCMNLLPALKVIHNPPINSASNINRMTLRMRVLYRYIFWRDNLADGSFLRLIRFWFGMLANLFLMLKQERRCWVIRENLMACVFICRHVDINWRKANEFILSRN